ncbi:lytic murein transglycosylase [Oceanicella actignis]|uniref:lytic murein transglycosylase n=1 Tax=Oceanicella actignis TaxID=1189325 RepID=UPI0011E7436A|nr:lytic murein transglycosylase [Oceanicella actignis]TYO89135.1 membrane-bound lytic murein transglycosylase B [Oceanicella actignis]
MTTPIRRPGRRALGRALGCALAASAHGAAAQQPSSPDPAASEARAAARSEAAPTPAAAEAPATRPRAGETAADDAAVKAQAAPAPHQADVLTAPAPAPRPEGAPAAQGAAAPVAALAPAPRPAPAADGAPAPAAAQAARAPAPAERTPPEFLAWRDGFRARALAAGIRPEVFDRAFAGVGVNARVLELDAYQPEFVRPIWEYLDRAVSPSRVERGRAELAAKRALLDRIEARFGVDRQYVLAIWGLESAFGVNYGDIPVIESLATLAWHGRRRGFAEAQLIAALRIIQNGDVAPERMLGSWAGAMGHTQFIPTSFLDYAVDFDGDGRRDVWSADAADALASTAAYLARFGWRKGAPWGVEVRLPAGFDYALADERVRRPAAFWRALGLTRADGGPLPDEDEGAVVLPAGAQGPAFLTYANFRVFKRYNNATSYALAAGLLGDRIMGAGPLSADWPRGQTPLSRAEKVELQTLLTRMGHDTGGADGIIGPNSRAAIRAFQKRSGMVPDGVESKPVLDAVRRAAGG